MPRRLVSVILCVIGVFLALVVCSSPQAIGNENDATYEAWITAHGTSYLDAESYRDWMRWRRARSVAQKVRFGSAGAILVGISVLIQLTSGNRTLSRPVYRRWLATGAGVGGVVASTLALWGLSRTLGEAMPASAPAGAQALLGAFILAAGGIVLGSILASELALMRRFPIIGVCVLGGLWIVVVNTWAAYHGGILDTRFDLYRSLRLDVPWAAGVVALTSLATVGVVVLRQRRVPWLASGVALALVGSVVTYFLARPTLNPAMELGWDRIVPGVSGVIVAWVMTLAWGAIVRTTTCANTKRRLA